MSNNIRQIQHCLQEFIHVRNGYIIFMLLVDFHQI